MYIIGTVIIQYRKKNEMTTQYLKAKYNLTTLEANVFLFWNVKGFVLDGMDSVLVRVLRKVNK